jgi:anaerobic magnesium-protoporphyrin IX monomethyl ester cyclase
MKATRGMTEVLLGQGYYQRFDPKLEEAGQPYPPLGALIAAACLRRAGHAPSLFDSMLAASPREWDEALSRTRPAVAVVYEDSFNYLSKMCLGRMREASFTMLEAARARGCVTLVSGSDATDHDAEYLARGATAVIRGEGEATLCEAVDALAAGGEPALRSVSGLSLRGGDGSIVRTAPRPFIKDLDALPLPAWDLVDWDRYRRVWRSRHGYHSINLATTRGCPYHCNWCAKPIYGQRYAVRSPQAVAEEMALLKRTYAPDHFSFVDDIFGLRPGWVEEFARAVDAVDARLPFRCLTRADLLGDDTVAALRHAGCRTVWIGAESGSQRVLDAMEKGDTVEDIRRAAARLHAAGIEVGFFLQFGYPGETREDIELTRRLVAECRPDDIGISVSYPLPGTRFYERVQAQLGAKRNWDDSNDLAMMYRGPFSTEFYRALHRVVHQEFRLRRLRGRVRRPRQAAAMLYHAVTLPWARRRLERVARRPHEGIGPLRAALSPAQAAVPSEQGS